MNSQLRIDGKYFLRGNNIKLFFVAFISFILRWSAILGYSFIFYKIIFEDTIKNIILIENEYFNLLLKILCCSFLCFLLIIFSTTIKSLEKYIFFETTTGRKTKILSKFKFFNIKTVLKLSFLFLKIHLLKIFWLSFYAFPCCLCLSLLLYIKTVSTVPPTVFIVLCFGCSVILSLSLFMYKTSVFRYYCAPYYLFFNPTTKINKALEKSLYATDKYLQEAVIFNTSFLGWWISCIFILPLFYVLPYYKLCKAMFIYQCTSNKKVKTTENKYAINYLKLEKNQESI